MQREQTHGQTNNRRTVSIRKKPTHLIIVWAIYLIAVITLLLWIVFESHKFLALYQQSPQCSIEVFTTIPQDCRGMIDVQVYNKWISTTPGGGAKGGGHLDKMNFIVSLPNGDRRTLSVQINNDGLSDQGQFNLFYISRFFEMEEGKIAQAEYWEGRVISVTIPLPVILGDPSSESTETHFRTDDHPENYLSKNLSKALALLGILFTALILWTAIVILHH